MGQDGTNPSGPLSDSGGQVCNACRLCIGKIMIPCRSLMTVDVLVSGKQRPSSEVHSSNRALDLCNIVQPVACRFSSACFCARLGTQKSSTTWQHESIGPSYQAPFCHLGVKLTSKILGRYAFGQRRMPAMEEPSEGCSPTI
jgi:hypothetical protein